MNTTAIVDLVCALFIAILYIRRIPDQKRTGSNRALNLCLVIMCATLLTDAMAFTFVGPSFSLPLRFFINFLAFIASCVNVIAFTFYLESLFSEKGRVGPWLFRAVKIVEYAWLLATAFEYFSGHLLSYDINGVENLDYTFPPYIIFTNLAIHTCLLIITILHHRSTGTELCVRLSLFEVAPIITSVLYSFAGIDFTYAVGSIMLGLVAEFVQKTQTRRMIREENITRELANQQRYMKAFGDMVNAGLWTIRISDSDEIIDVFWSDEARHMLGFSGVADFPNEIGSWTGIIHPEDKAAVLEHFEKSIGSRDTEHFVYDVEFRMRRKNGEYSWYHTVGRMEYNPDRTRNLFGILFDISAERKLKEQQALSDGLAREYHTVWLMDGFGRHNLHLYRSTGKTTVRSAVQLGLDEPCFDTSVVKYIRDNVLEEDQERVIAETRFETIERMTPEIGTYVVTYRRYTNDRTDYTYHQMCFARATGADGTVSYILAYRDADQMMREQITQQKQLQDALDSANIEAKRNDILIDTISGGRFTYAISAQDEVTGAVYSELSRERIGAEYLDKTDWIKLLHPEDHDRVLKAFMDCVRDHTGNTAYDVTFRLKGTDGKYRWVRSGGRVIRQADGSGEFYGISLDITGQIEAEARREKQLEEALARAKEETVRRNMVYRISDSSQWSYEIATDDSVVSVSYSDQLLSLVDADAMKDPMKDPMAWTGLLHPEDRDRVVSGFMAAIRDHSGNTLYDESYRMIGADGDQRRFRSVGRVIRRPDGTGEFIGMATDFTAQFRQEEEQQRRLAEALGMADAANRAKTDFLFNMSHDIRTPMNAIIGFTGIAKKEIRNPEKALACLEKVQLSSEILLNLINDVLDMSRIESGKVELHEERYEITEAFDSFEAAMSGLAASKDIDLSFVIGDVRDRFIYADGPRFDRVMINIISNAIKYTHAEGFVKVSVDQVGDTRPGYGNYRFIVADSGIGMSPEFQKHMFEDFTREENTTTSRVQGTGLGLSLAKKLVEMMGGSISCVSTQGIGTTFTIIFPFRLQTGADRAEEKPSVPADVRVDLRGKRALLVEDNELNREIACEILSDEGVIVDTAADGQKAVNKVREHGPDRFDFILMDIQMPVMNGYEATEMIHRLVPDLRAPIIALSANAFAEDQKKSIEAGMDAHVAKPINIRELFEALARFL